MSDDERLRGHAARVVAMDEEDDAALILAIAKAIWNAGEKRNPIHFTKLTWEQGSEVARAHRLDDAIAALAAFRAHMREDVLL